MKHRIRINGEVKELDCELGSGVLDKNGREIFEGDKIRINGKDVCSIYWTNRGWQLQHYWGYYLDEIVTSALEIVYD